MVTFSKSSEFEKETYSEHSMEGKSSKPRFFFLFCLLWQSNLLLPTLSMSGVQIRD